VTKKPYKDLTGQRFGRLTVASLVASPAGTQTPTKWVCLCDCGSSLIVRGYNLKSGNTLSCGCLQKDRVKETQTTHGMTGTRLYVIWQHIIGRCARAKDKAYKWYGARGITICDEWLNSFEAFYEWAMSHGYSDDLTIDRIDVNGNYCPENCRWITLKEQQRNKRDNVRVSFNGQVKTVAEWAKEFNCYSSAVYREILKREGRLYSETY
jgi:hypothetical protein